MPGSISALVDGRSFFWVWDSRPRLSFFQAKPDSRGRLSHIIKAYIEWGTQR